MKSKKKKHKKPNDEKQRRIANAAENGIEFQRWCTKNGWRLEVTDNDRHWRMYRHGIFCQWWPSTGKFVANEEYGSAAKCDSLTDVMEQLMSLVQGGE